MIIPLVAEHAEEIAELCRRYEVQRLELFGSAATGKFNPDTSDLDFLVTYQPDADLGPWLGKFSEFRESLRELFGRSVDLVENRNFSNPYFRESVEASRTSVYEG